MVYIYRPVASNGAQDLANATGGIRLRHEREGRFYRYRTSARPVVFAPGDIVIGWGAPINITQPGVQVLNGRSLTTKYQDAVTLKAAGVPTIDAVKTCPPAPTVEDPARPWHRTLVEMAEDVLEADYARSPIYLEGLQELQQACTHLLEQLRQPIPAPMNHEWLPRKNSHVGGNDLLIPPAQPDFYVKKLNLVQEFRIHSFMGKSIRAGTKVVREDQPAHPWIRSWDGGWKIHYDGVTSKQVHRNLAHAAVEALGLSFGAVDIGVTDTGTLVVLEVNRAPGIEGGTVEAYAKAIRTQLPTQRVAA
jgi:hypothetical protein